MEQRCFPKRVEQQHKTITDKISRYFTPVLLLLVVFSFCVLDFFIDVTTAFNVFTAILIVACPMCVGINGSVYIR